MTLDERLRNVVADTARAWPKKVDSEELLKLLDTFMKRIKAACLEEQS